MLHLRLFNSKKQQGSLLVEIVVVSGIVAGSLAAILGLAAFFLATAHVVQQTSQATALAQETVEIVRNVRDGAGWAALAIGGPYHPEQSGIPPQWVFVAGSDAIGEFTRQVRFEQVYRDANDAIASSGSVDPETIKAVVQVAWAERGKSHEVELEAYFTNWNQ